MTQHSFTVLSSVTVERVLRTRELAISVVVAVEDFLPVALYINIGAPIWQITLLFPFVQSSDQTASKVQRKKNVFGKSQS